MRSPSAWASKITQPARQTSARQDIPIFKDFKNGAHIPNRAPAAKLCTPGPPFHPKYFTVELECNTNCTEPEVGGFLAEVGGKPLPNISFGK